MTIVDAGIVLAQHIQRFGLACAVENQVVAVGAPGFSAGNGSNGAVFLFGVRPGGLWETGTLFASDGQSGDDFGAALGFSDTLFVGAPGEDELGSRAGAAYAFGGPVSARR